MIRKVILMSLVLGAIASPINPVLARPKKIVIQPPVPPDKTAKCLGFCQSGCRRN
ncbi:MAG: hypothetical protein PUP93_16220 [Rhizonema sp. NSF051]|nr:hypothetical protein [Rhizonema sp. NSF051]